MKAKTLSETANHTLPLSFARALGDSSDSVISKRDGRMLLPLNITFSVVCHTGQRSAFTMF